MASERERFLQEMALQGDPWVRSHVHVTYPVYQQYGDQLDKLQSISPHVSVGIGRTSSRAAGSEQTDPWGCRWLYPLESLDGLCVEHPLASWGDLKGYRPPDPAAFTDWKEAARNAAQARAEGRVSGGGTDHGFVFLRLTYLRGFENLMLDLAEERPELDELIAVVENYWMGVASRWVEAGVDTIGFGDDLGLQHALPISPAAWRRYIGPTYRRIFTYCRERGVHVSLHSDGYILDIIPDLIACGVSVLNPQDLVNGLDHLRRLAHGRVCLNLDVDRQTVTVFGTPAEVESHVHQCIATLGSKRGGLTLIWGVYPGTPLENIEAAVHAMAEAAGHWA
ncbi:MAG: uroporphyrinogen decarboxylase family protein [Candidatus Latescibacterota bacterium]|jgi:hypothetical protein